MKIFKFLAVALVAMLGFTACEKDCDHDFIEHDHSADLVGTWTCIQDGFAEALVIKADGTAVSYGVEDGKYWENVKGTVTVKDNNITMIFEDDDNWTGHFDVIPGMAFSLFEENGERYIYNYCKEDLSEEIVGMWVNNETKTGDGDVITVQTFLENGKAIFTGYGGHADEYQVNDETTYKVIGDLLIMALPKDKIPAGVSSYLTKRLIYSPDGTAHGDIMTHKVTKMVDGKEKVILSNFLRVKQSLDLASKKYDYIKTFVTNVDGLDKDIDFMGYTFNFAKMDGVKLDKMLKTLLFAVEFPDANTIKYSCHYNNEPMSMDAPIVVDGNKMTVKMSTRNAAYKDVDLYTFQDKDNTQMHMYMPTYAFINFFGNMQATIMSQMGDLDLTDAAAVKAVFDSIDDAVETINLSLVMTKAK